MKPYLLAKRFVAGTTLDKALEVAKKLNKEGLKVAFDHLGEEVEDRVKAVNATRTYEAVILAIKSNKLSADISIKLSQIGLTIDKEFAKKNLFDIIKIAKKNKIRIEFDMEGSKYTEDTIDLYLSALKKYRDVVLAIQSYMRRSEEDVKRVISKKGKIRLVKGTYKESEKIIFAKNDDVNANYMKLMKLCLLNDTFIDIGTHNDILINKAKNIIKKNNIPKSKYEFEMLYGIRNKLQRELSKEGFPVRVYMPYGEDWLPYFTRRMAERKENFFFVIKNIFRK